MSSASSGGTERGAAPAQPPELDRLAGAVRRLLDDHAAWKRRTERAERRLEELETTLRTSAAEEGPDPVGLAETVERLRRENADLQRRLNGARQVIERIVSRLRFLEDAR